LAAVFAEDLRRARRIGLALMLLSGGLLFWLHPHQYYISVFFRIKMLLLLVVIRTKVASPLSLALWIAIIFASRGIAFF
jgi:hypothetical protein